MLRMFLLSHGYIWRPLFLTWPLSCGVPQGCILGLIIFALHSCLRDKDTTSVFMALHMIHLSLLYRYVFISVVPLSFL